MNKLKESLPIIIVVGLFLAVCALAFYLVIVRSVDHFTQIDNTHMSELSSNEYQYELTAFDEHGKMHDVKFTAYKKLREGAYLKLKVMAVRGVVGWEEIQYDELPLDTRTHLAAPAEE